MTSTSPVDRNRLDEEASSYLAAHADNPVNWQPWDERALAAARECDRPIFLSIGYAACHWCHVMAEESFSDPAVAELLNDGFVPIKVDREERPDLDSIYMTVCQRVTGRGGWPLSVWLTPDGRPFHVGTYYPPEQRRGTPAFSDVLEGIGEAWTDPERREELETRADRWAELADPDADRETTDRGTIEGSDADGADGELLESAAEATVRGADREHGGWGTGQKFPHPARLEVLFRAHNRTGREQFRTVAVETIDAMATGGLFDHVGGGFHRYATDREWTVPHFEKMLYDNAELARTYVAGAALTGEDRYESVARETLAFLEAELQRPDGGFDSSLDARSGPDRAEGAYYTWTPGEIEAAVDDPDDAALFCERYGIAAPGDIDGRSVPRIERSVPELAEAHETTPAAVEAGLDRALEGVRAARRKRPSPPRDEKLLAGWNGLAIGAFAEAGLVLEDRYTAVARKAAETVRERLWTFESGRLNRRYAGGTAKIEGYLEDYAYFGRGLIRLYEATGDSEWLTFAVKLARAIEAEFWDSESETLYFAPDTDELVARPTEIRDGSTPSSTGVAVELFDAVSRFVDDGFDELAATILETHRQTIRSAPVEHATLVLADDAVARRLELTLAGGTPPDWPAALADRYVSPRIISRRPASDRLGGVLDDLGQESVPPIWADRDADGAPTVYACREFVCSPPQSSLAGALAWADDQSS